MVSNNGSKIVNTISKNVTLRSWPNSCTAILCDICIAREQIICIGLVVGMSSLAANALRLDRHGPVSRANLGKLLAMQTWQVSPVVGTRHDR